MSSRPENEKHGFPSRKGKNGGGGIRKAGSTDTAKLVAAFKGLKVETPIGPITFRAVDGQSTMGAWVGTTKIDSQRGVGVMVNHEYVAGEKVLPSDDEVKKMRSGN